MTNILDCFDIAVIGGGVVGCATARRFAIEGQRVVLLERGRDILSGASKANSAILHTGFDAPAGSLELACMLEGRREYHDIQDRLNLPLLATGAVMIAWTQAEQARLESIVGQAHENGIFVERITTRQLESMEPGVSLKALDALHIPDEAVIDPWSAPLAYITQAVALGTQVRRNIEVLSGTRDETGWRLETSGGPIAAGVVINCAGLHGDTVSQRLGLESPFSIRPRKGQFVVFDKAARDLINAIILPVPSAISKGVLIAPTIFGNLLVGPTAEEQDDRERVDTDSSTLKQLVAKAAEIVPGLLDADITAAYAGLRPATETKAYHVQYRPEERYGVIGGIRSTGLTAALGLARYMHRLFAADRVDNGGITTDSSVKTWTQVPNLADHHERDWQRAGYGEIVCHCELVTRREIEKALSGPLGARDLGGLKRRTRCTMGRCQGFYCSGRLAELSAGHFDTPSAEGAHHG